MTLSPTSNVHVRRSYRLMDSLKGVHLGSINIFHVNLGKLSIPPDQMPNIVDNHSSHNSHDEDDSLTWVSPTQVLNLVNSLEKIEH